LCYTVRVTEVGKWVPATQEETMSQTITYSVPGMTCDHCKHAVSTELGAVAGVAGVDVDLGTKLVKVTGESLDDVALRAAIEEAGYEAA
jgi:copper chaperone CopZ